MPRMIRFDGEPRDLRGEFPVATEEELLEFVNKARAAGGANILEALLPSTPSLASACLIANGLNFGCNVAAMPGTSSLQGKDGYRFVWAMHLPYNISPDQAEEIAKALGCELHGDDNGDLFIGPLPPHIGNAADAFDERLAFTEFIGPSPEDI